jgi:formylglycine-generating enzyme required for sulfatase activity
MIFVSSGIFEMGSGAQYDEPPHTVEVSDFYLGRTEVTFGEYDAFCEATDREKPIDEGWGRGQRPVINVSWYDAVAYCNWRSTQDGYTPVYTISGEEATANWAANGYRLPTEAEWEYAAREGGKAVRFGNGKDIADPAEINFDGTEDFKTDYSILGKFRDRTVPVGSLNSPNALGLHDMSGNVLEWCWDFYDRKYYQNSPSQNPRGPASGDDRVDRGGSWNGNPRLCLAVSRSSWGPAYGAIHVGFRLARTAE